jgi:hypothetical protein
MPDLVMDSTVNGGYVGAEPTSGADSRVLTSNDYISILRICDSMISSTYKSFELK